MCAESSADTASSGSVSRPNGFTIAFLRMHTDSERFLTDRGRDIFIRGARGALPP